METRSYMYMVNGQEVDYSTFCTVVLSSRIISEESNLALTFIRALIQATTNSMAQNEINRLVGEYEVTRLFAKENPITINGAVFSILKKEEVTNEVSA